LALKKPEFPCHLFYGRDKKTRKRKKKKKKKKKKRKSKGRGKKKRKGISCANRCPQGKEPKGLAQQKKDIRVRQASATGASRKKAAWRKREIPRKDPKGD